MNEIGDSMEFDRYFLKNCVGNRVNHKENVIRNLEFMWKIEKSQISSLFRRFIAFE